VQLSRTMAAMDFLGIPRSNSILSPSRARRIRFRSSPDAERFEIPQDRRLINPHSAASHVSIRAYFIRRFHLFLPLLPALRNAMTACRFARRVGLTTFECRRLGKEFRRPENPDESVADSLVFRLLAFPFGEERKR